MLINQNDKIIHFRNKLWDKNLDIPKWVNKNNVDLDQFYTKPEIAKKCYTSLKKFLEKEKVNESYFKFVEPSAGTCAFYNLLPKNRRIGIDLIPNKKEIIKQDFLSWQPKKNGYDYITIGNPPFGYRAWLALIFLNHAAKFSKYVGMILPMAFQSEGKSSAKHRVRGLKLISSEVLPQDSFQDVNGKTVKVNALWQIWERGENIIDIPKKCDSYVDIFTVDLRKERLCGHIKMKNADFFLQRTFYRDQPKLVKSFTKVKYVCGYGFIIKKNKKNIVNILNNANWEEYSNLAAHNCRHTSIYHIKKLLTDKGIID